MHQYTTNHWRIERSKCSLVVAEKVPIVFKNKRLGFIKKNWDARCWPSRFFWPWQTEYLFESASYCLFRNVWIRKDAYKLWFLCNHFGIYLVALKYDLNYGSTDMTTMIEKLGKLTKDDPYKNETYVKRHMRCILAARFFILNKLRLYSKEIAPDTVSNGRHWLVQRFNTYFPCLSWEHLEDTLINLMSSILKR